MIGKRSVDRFTFTVTVSGGTGTYTFQKLGHIKIIAFRAPTQAATWDYEIKDSDSYGIAGKAGQQGNVTISGDIPVATQCTLTLSNATNGSYSGVIYMDTGA